MKVQEILDIAADVGLSIGMYGRPKLTDMGDGTRRFIKNDTLTIYGKQVLEFAHKIIEKSQEVQP